MKGGTAQTPVQDFDPISVNAKLCFLAIYNVVALVGISGYIIASIAFLIIYRNMRYMCEPIFNLW